MKIITCEYVSPRRHTVFDIPLALVGTDFQKRVWNALGGVPYGETPTLPLQPRCRSGVNFSTSRRSIDGWKVE